MSNKKHAIWRSLPSTPSQLPLGLSLRFTILSLSLISLHISWFSLSCVSICISLWLSPSLPHSLTYPTTHIKPHSLTQTDQQTLIILFLECMDDFNIIVTLKIKNVFCDKAQKRIGSWLINITLPWLQAEQFIIQCQTTGFKNKLLSVLPLPRLSLSPPPNTHTHLLSSLLSKDWGGGGGVGGGVHL